MLKPNPADALHSAPVSDLVVLLLKQFRRLLNQHDISLTTAQMEQIGAQVASGTHAPDAVALVAALHALVAESESVLRDRFDLSYAQSLASDMNSIGGWETTADFLEIANHKSNAELRISAGASLLVFLGDTRYAEHLFTAIADDAGMMDVDAMFAKRALSHHTGVDFSAEDWDAQVRARLI
jgi:hypothetical protein